MQADFYLIVSNENSQGKIQTCFFLVRQFLFQRVKTIPSLNKGEHFLRLYFDFIGEPYLVSNDKENQNMLIWHWKDNDWQYYSVCCIRKFIFLFFPAFLKILLVKFKYNCVVVGFLGMFWHNEKLSSVSSLVWALVCNFCWAESLLWWQSQADTRLVLNNWWAWGWLSWGQVGWRECPWDHYYLLSEDFVVVFLFWFGHI